MEENWVTQKNVGFYAGNQKKPVQTKKITMATKTDIKADFQHAEIQGKVTQPMINKILKKVVNKMVLNPTQENAIASLVNKLVSTEFNSAVKQAIDPETNTFDQKRSDSKTLKYCHGKTPNPKSDTDACIMEIIGQNESLFSKHGINEDFLLNELRGAVMQVVLESKPEPKSRPATPTSTQGSGSTTPTSTQGSGSTTPTSTQSSGSATPTSTQSSESEPITREDALERLNIISSILEKLDEKK